MSDELIVLVTVPSSDEAAQIGESLVSERLAACVNIVAEIDSIYRWEGKVARNQELLLVIKTTGDRYSAIERRVKELHSYSTPEIIAVKIEHGSPEYLRWVKDSTKVADA